MKVNDVSAIAPIAASRISREAMEISSCLVEMRGASVRSLLKSITGTVGIG